MKVDAKVEVAAAVLAIKKVIDLSNRIAIVDEAGRARLGLEWSCVKGPMRGPLTSEQLAAVEEIPTDELIALAERLGEELRIAVATSEACYQRGRASVGEDFPLLVHKAIDEGKVE